MTARGMNFITLATLKTPNRIWMTPVKIVAASKYSSPWSRTSGTINSAIAPVAAEIIAGRPPAMAVTTAMQNEA